MMAGYGLLALSTPMGEAEADEIADAFGHALRAMHA